MTVLCCFCKKELTEKNWTVGLVETIYHSFSGKFCNEICAVADIVTTVGMNGLTTEDVSSRLAYIEQYITDNKDRHKKEKTSA